MAHFLDSVITDINVSQLNLYNALSTLETQLYWSGYYLSIGDYANGGGYLQTASTKVYDLRVALTTLTSSFAYQTRLGFVRIRTYWPEDGAEVDMDAILSAMVKADPDQTEYFVGVVDAYRQSIWNRPFNKEFFAALARGFEQWP